MFFKTNRELKLITKQLDKIENEELVYLQNGQNGTFSEKFAGIKEKIPQKALDGLELAFRKGLYYIIKKGDGILEKTGGLEKNRASATGNIMALQMLKNKKNIKQVDKLAKQRVANMKAGTVVEGTTLGVLGIGLPDIPVFLGVLFKSVYEIGAAYGYDYRNPKERKFVIHIFYLAFSQGRDKIKYSAVCDNFSKALDDGALSPDEYEISEKELNDLAKLLATDMLVAKFIQGLPIAGILGGPINYFMVDKVSKAAKIKYKKRLLTKMLHELENKRLK